MSVNARNFMHDITPEANDGPPPGGKTIRDLRPSATRQRLQPRMEQRPELTRKAPRARWGIWIAAVLLLAVFGGAGALMLFPSARVTITPRTHIVTFDTSNPITVYPAGAAATGTIPYTVISQTFEESSIVEARGTERAEEKASGSITIYNQTTRVMRLIKNTRFQNADGLVFRIPASVDVPAQSGTTPGTATVTVFADEAGPKYNIGPAEFTLPGLKSSPDYTKITARSSAAFTGGFVGDRPAVAADVLESQKAQLRARLAEKAGDLWRTAPADAIAFPGLLVISYETLPAISEPGGGVRITERAVALVPILPQAAFATAIARAVSADADVAPVSLSFAEQTSAQPVGALDAADVGRESITFSILGRGRLMWELSPPELQQALAGKEKAAFEPIVQGFVAVEEARARLMPFWKNSFPKDPSDIAIILNPATDW